jgi:hypothetical protein
MWEENQERLLILFIVQRAISWNLKQFIMTIRHNLAIVQFYGRFIELLDDRAIAPTEN